MSKFQNNVVLFSALLLSVVGARPALAGTITLTSGTWDRICKVETMEGLNAPTNGTLGSSSNVSSGATVGRYTDKVCYRRDNSPPDCSSGLTNWRCYINLNSGSSSEDVR